MFVYPVREGVPLPPEFEQHAIVPAEPLTMDAERIAAGRDRWIDEWTEIVLN
jgi:thiamine transport system substrate-binding protein